MNRTTLKIDGMTCGHCVKAVSRALDDLDGVTIENVAIGSAVVTYDPAIASADAIAAAVSDTGYTATAAD